MCLVQTIEPNHLVDDWRQALVGDEVGLGDVVVQGEVHGELEVLGNLGNHRLVGVEVDAVERGQEDDFLVDLESLDCEVVLSGAMHYLHFSDVGVFFRLVLELKVVVHVDIVLAVVAHDLVVVCRRVVRSDMFGRDKADRAGRLKVIAHIDVLVVLAFHGVVVIVVVVVVYTRVEILVREIKEARRERRNRRKSTKQQTVRVRTISKRRENLPSADTFAFALISERDE
jgi:hypothetical protein